MPVQTSYPLNHSAAVVGAVVDGQIKNVRSGVATVAIPFGRFVARTGSAEIANLKLPTLATDVTAAAAMGVAVRLLGDAAGAGDVAQYEIGRNVSFLDFGVVYVLLDEDVTAGGPAFVRYAAGGAGLGTFGDTAGTSERAALAGATFQVGGTAGQIVPVRIRMTNGS
jgi:hypothetical protein